MKIEKSMKICSISCSQRSAKDVKWAAGFIGLLTSKSSLLAFINMKVMTSLQEGTVGHLNGLSLKLTEPFTLTLACLLVPLTRSLAPHSLLRSSAPLRSFVCSLTHSLAPELIGKIYALNLYHFNPQRTGPRVMGDVDSLLLSNCTEKIQYETSNLK